MVFAFAWNHCFFVSSTNYNLKIEFYAIKCTYIWMSMNMSIVECTLLNTTFFQCNSKRILLRMHEKCQIQCHNEAPSVMAHHVVCFLYTEHIAAVHLKNPLIIFIPRSAKSSSFAWYAILISSGTLTNNYFNWIRFTICRTSYCLT